MSISTSKMLGKLGGSVQDAGNAQLEQGEDYDAPQLMPTSSPKMSQDMDMKHVLAQALGLSSSKKNSPMDS